MAEQMTFEGGLNAQSSPDKLAPNEVQLATNVDFGMEEGAASARRGSIRFATMGVATQIRGLYRHYNKPFSLDESPIYVAIGGAVYRGTTGGAFTQILAGDATDLTGFTSFRNHAFIANGSATNCIKDDGTTTTDWVKQVPAAPTIAISTLAPLVLGTVWTAAEGTLVGSGTTTCTINADEISFRAQFNTTLLTTNLDTNGSSPIGDSGIDYVDILFSEPKLVTRISRDYSIGDTTFTNYWHTELDVEVDESAMPAGEVLVDSQLNEGTSTDTNVDLATREEMIAALRQNIRAPLTRVSAAANTFNVWAVPRTRFELISRDQGAAGWSNIQAVRVVVECEGPITIKLRNHDIRGAKSYPLNDADVGYAYWETWATIDTADGTTKHSEGAASPASARLKVQGARIIVTSTSTATTTSHGLTHRIWYRQGGYMRAPYAVGTSTGVTAAATFTDSMSDIEALSVGDELERNILTRAAFPNSIVALSEPHYNRLFAAYDNKLIWSLPNRPESFPRTSITEVSHAGDYVQGLMVWTPNIVVVNRDSVYEISGSEFEGAEANWIKQRTGSRNGSKAARTIIRTPVGIPLLNYDGLSMYIPGQGVDAPVTWVMEKIGDVWRGNGPTNPVALKGERVPAINKSYINRSCAAWAEGKLYLGCATGTSTSPNTLFVLDMKAQRVQHYTYPFNFGALWWDFVDNRLFAGADNGCLMQLEIGQHDRTTSDVVTAISYKIRSRKWTVPADTVMNNIAVDHLGSPTVVRAIYDTTNTTTLGTSTRTTRGWFVPPLNGTLANSAEFEVEGTCLSTTSAGVHSIGWDALTEPVQVRYYRTEYDAAGAEGEKLWDVHAADIAVLGTGTVTAVLFVDGVAVNTYTYTGTARDIRRNSVASETYGDIAFTTYTSSDANTFFKHWNTKVNGRPEPPRVNSWRTDIESIEEQIVDAFDTDINPNGTALGTVFVDNTALATGTFTGTKRQSHTTTVPIETYGRTIHTLYSGTGLKHYRTWYHLREEPDRWTSFVSPREDGPEAEFPYVRSVLNCLGGTVLATAMVDEVAVATYTCTGSGHQVYARAMPTETYGRTAYVIYAASGTGRFKHFASKFERLQEPEKLSTVHAGPYTYPSSNYPRTLITEINPNGTALATLRLDGTVTTTYTFTGTIRNTYNRGIELTDALVLRTSTVADVIYNGTNIKHYKTQLETEPKPFGKTSWSVTYRKAGGATQLDMLRFWSYDIECPTGTATFTAIWDIDGTPFTTYTGTVVNRQWADRIKVPPGGRGYLFQLRLLANNAIHVWKSNIDIERVGIKGLSRVGAAGLPATGHPDV